MSRTDSATPTENQSKSVKEIAESAKGLAGDAKAAATEAYGQARDLASEKYSQLREQAGEYYEQGKQKIGEYEGQLENYVREQPVKSLLIAAGVGVLVGIILKRR